MTVESPGRRPALFPSSVAQKLLEFLRFRNFFRNTYGAQFRTGHVMELADEWQPLWDTVRASLHNLCAHILRIEQ